MRASGPRTLIFIMAFALVAFVVSGLSAGGGWDWGAALVASIFAFIGALIGVRIGRTLR